jgi:catecholate siderophore receptor
VFTGTGFARVDRTGNTPAFAPEHILNLWVTKEWENGFGAAVGPRFVSSQFIAEDNAFEIDGYATLDAAVFYDLDRWRFSVNFRNITDTAYELRGFGTTSVTPADPAAVYVGVDFKL